MRLIYHYLSDYGLRLISAYGFWESRDADISRDFFLICLLWLFFSIILTIFLGLFKRNKKKSGRYNCIMWLTFMGYICFVPRALIHWLIWLMGCFIFAIIKAIYYPQNLISKSFFILNILFYIIMLSITVFHIKYYNDIVKLWSVNELICGLKSPYPAGGGIQVIIPEIINRGNSCVELLRKEMKKNFKKVKNTSKRENWRVDRFFPLLPYCLAKIGGRKTEKFLGKFIEKNFHFVKNIQNSDKRAERIKVILSIFIAYADCGKQRAAKHLMDLYRTASNRKKTWILISLVKTKNKEGISFILNHFDSLLKIEDYYSRELGLLIAQTLVNKDKKKLNNFPIYPLHDFYFYISHLHKGNAIIYSRSKELQMLFRIKNIWKEKEEEVKKYWIKGYEGN